MDPLIRVATVEDIDALYHVRTAVVQNHLSREQMTALGITPQALAESIRQQPCAWVAEVDDRLVAFSMVDMAEGEVFAMFVLPAYENRGLGRSLMAVAEQALFRRHARIYLITDGRESIRANGFYQRLGWNRIGTAEGHDVRYEKHAQALSST